MIEIEVDIRAQGRPVRDQGRRLTCLAHAFSGAHEIALGDGLYRSPEYLHWFTPAGSFGGAAAALRDRGQPEEAACPYLAADPGREWRPQRSETMRRDHALLQPSASAVFTVLKAGWPAILGLSIPRSFLSVTAPWIITAPGVALARHAVVAVGLGRGGAEPAILIRNSWGEAWADRGHAWVSETFLAQHLHDAAVLHPEVFLGDFH